MNTWNVARWMSEGKKVFNAVTQGPEDAIKFGDKSRNKEPYFDCNTQHRVQGWRTRSGSGNDSHALTDSIIIDYRLRDTEDGWSYNTDNSYKHEIEYEIKCDDEVIHSGRLRGGFGDNGWISSNPPLLITKPGKWSLRYWSVDAGACGRPKGWVEVGSFTAKEAHEDCFMKYRQDTDELGVCGECMEGYTESGGNCVAETSDDGTSETSDGMGGSSGSSNGSTDNTTAYMIGGGVILLALLLRRKKQWR